MTQDLQVVWLKRDLRLTDHAPLRRAARRGPIVVLYVHEPSLLRSPEYDGSHHDFIVESLRELDCALRRLGQRLVVRHGEMPQVLEALGETLPFAQLWSHQETGNRLTYDRDLRVARWCKARQLAWTELSQNGIIRPLRHRDGWAQRWTATMRSAKNRSSSLESKKACGPSTAFLRSVASTIAPTCRARSRAGTDVHD